MVRLAPTLPEDHRELFRILLIAEPYHEPDMTMEHFKMVTNRRTAWTVRSEDRIIGCVSYGEYMPGVDITLHVYIDPEFHGRWMSRSVLRTGFRFPFISLDLPRVSGFCLVGLSDHAGNSLERLGFAPEGVRRKACMVMNKLWDVKLFGMLREECRWLK